MNHCHRLLSNHWYVLAFLVGIEGLLPVPSVVYGQEPIQQAQREEMRSLLGSAVMAIESSRSAPGVRSEAKADNSTTRQQTSRRQTSSRRTALPSLVRSGTPSRTSSATRSQRQTSSRRQSQPLPAAAQSSTRPVPASPSSTRPAPTSQPAPAYSARPLAATRQTSTSQIQSRPSGRTGESTLPQPIANAAPLRNRTPVHKPALISAFVSKLPPKQPMQLAQASAAAPASGRPADQVAKTSAVEGNLFAPTVRVLGVEDTSQHQSQQPDVVAQSDHPSQPAYAETARPPASQPSYDEPRAHHAGGYPSEYESVPERGLSVRPAAPLTAPPSAQRRDGLPAQESGQQHDRPYQQLSYHESRRPAAPLREQDFRREDYRRDDYQRDDYQRGDYQRDDYQRDDYQRDDYQRDGYQHDDYRREGYQRDDYQYYDYSREDYRRDHEYSAAPDYARDPRYAQRNDYEAPRDYEFRDEYTRDRSEAPRSRYRDAYGEPQSLVTYPSYEVADERYRRQQYSRPVAPRPIPSLTDRARTFGDERVSTARPSARALSMADPSAPPAPTPVLAAPKFPSRALERIPTPAPERMPAPRPLAAPLSPPLVHVSPEPLRMSESRVSSPSHRQAPSHQQIPGQIPGQAPSHQQIPGQAFGPAISQDEFLYQSLSQTADQIDTHNVSPQQGNVAVQPGWWQSLVPRSLRTGAVDVPITLEETLYEALANSAQIRVFSQLPPIRKTAIVEADSAFDWHQFLDVQWDDLSDPVGNTLTTGAGIDRFRDHHIYGSLGVRRRTRTGGQFEVSQRAGHQDNNSQFFVPGRQGTSQITLGYTQPLLRGRGKVYNNSLVCLAQVDHAVSHDEYMRQLQSHLLEVSRAYWSMYLERGVLYQKMQTYDRAQKIVHRLQLRRAVDASASQIKAAEAALTDRESDLVRAFTAVKNAEARLRALVNSPRFGDFESLELIPVDVPSFDVMQVDLEHSVAQAIQQRPEVKQAIKQIKAASIRAGMAKHELMPVLNLITETYVAGLAAQGQVGQAWVNQFNQGEPGYSVGLQFEVPLGNRAAKARNERRALELKQLRDQYQVTLQTVQLEVKVAVREVETAKNELLSKQEVVRAREAQLDQLIQRWERLPNETITTSLVLENILRAQEELASAEYEYLQSQITYNLSHVNLRKATGTLFQHQTVNVGQ